jgi:hypothetical protein
MKMGVVVRLPFAALLAAVVLAPPRQAARAQDQPGREAPAERPEVVAMRQWFAELDDPDASVREAARLKLMGIRREDLGAFQDLVRSSLPLVPSQAAVLRQIVTHVYLAGDKYLTNNTEGFLGVKMQETSVRLPAGEGAEQFAPAVGVVIVERMPGFVGARMLLDGDVILGIMERPDIRTLGMYEFQLVVKAVSPGSLIHFQVLRQGQVVRVPVAPDPRPSDADTMMQNLIRDRQQRADEYWEKSFGQLVKEAVG